VVQVGQSHDHEFLADRIFDACASRLSYFKVPGVLLFVQEIPVTTTKKIQKAALRAIAQAPLEQPGAIDWRSRKAALRGAMR
jgi:acyl-coenzyme A synthetase/AMP-(fatty) acid ligase